jgi:ATP-dependent Clp protease ATP-binding subunit ClpC
VLRHTGLDLQALVDNANTKKVSFGSLRASTYAGVIRKLLKQKVWTEEFFNKREIKSEDLLLASSWWDRKQESETKLGGDNLGRPGLALEMTFGYTPTLNQYSTDLSTPQSYSHRLIGRKNVVSRMERVLSAGSNVLLMGDPGVGKKTVVLEFAKRAERGQLGLKMTFKRVLEFDYNSLLSQSKDLNKKKTELALIFEEASLAGNIILMIRDIHRLTHPDVEGHDFTDVFEEYMEKGNLKIIAVATNSDYERFINPNLRLRKYLEKVEVTQPTKDEAMEILIESAQRWEGLTGMTILVPTLREILVQSDRYVTEVPFPEKAIELLDAVIIYCEQKSKDTLEIKDVNAVLAEKTGVSFSRLSSQELKRLGEIEDIIHQRLINQNAAVNLIGKTLRAKTIGVIKEDRPLGSFLFLGPTGVGKTETAKVLANVYYGSIDAIQRFDMAEYSGSEGLERLIGSTNKNLPGALTTAIKNRPASLLLLDEIEKASKGIYNLFLSLLDEGVITDAFGKRIIGRHLFVIGTSNAGAEFVRQSVEKGVKGEDLQKQVLNHVMEKELFSPEFINRFDGVVVYEPLKHRHLVKIAKLMLGDLAENLKTKGIQLTASEKFYEKLATDGYEPAFGARPMRRLVNINLGDLISKGILSGDVKEGDKIKLVPGGKKDEFLYEKLGR